MAALVLSVRTGTPPHVIDEVRPFRLRLAQLEPISLRADRRPLSSTYNTTQLYGPRDVFIPKMPSLGLLLEHPIFDSYNRKISSINANLQPTDAEYRPPIDFEVYREEIDRFKQKHIYDRMRDIEDRGGV